MKYSRQQPETDATSASPAFQIHIARAPQAIEEFDDLVNEHHYLGADCQGGDYLRQVVYESGSPIAVLAWGAACYSLKDRDIKENQPELLREAEKRLKASPLFLQKE
jgi:hypothetical protein